MRPGPVSSRPEAAIQRVCLRAVATWLGKWIVSRAAHGGHFDASVAPHGAGTIVVSPVSRSTRRSATGRMHTPSSTATASTTWRARV
jgi:hypothetical protein